ncbi:hypothetical protein [Cellulomonas sp. PhB143]|uniref:hypothetical protein n=1 Tax=Cellulomonas sp. PhB143 TaxID=2485186 RepID=UPI000F48828E|nr:hypothetical protein [Cellulomonas sp. PhB143]ROS76929.1 hypothetical protein EDF32_0915 [Cellulomonas sp. PhB143]
MPEQHPGPPPGWASWPAGTRAVVRARVHEPGATYADVLGVVVSADAGGIVLRRDTGPRAGTLERIGADDVALAKRVPPRPAPRARRERPGRPTP